MFFVNRPGTHNWLSMSCASSMRETHRYSKELHNYHMYQNFISRHLSNQSGIIVLSNWPRAHCGILQFTEASSLGPDSPRTSPRNETVKQCSRQMTVANSPVQWPSWTWCRKLWNHSWRSSGVTLNQRCFASIRPRTRLVYRYHVISRTESHNAVFGCSPSGWMSRAVVWQMSNFCIGRIEYGPGRRHRLTQNKV